LLQLPLARYKLRAVSLSFACNLLGTHAQVLRTDKENSYGENTPQLQPSSRSTENCQGAADSYRNNRKCEFSDTVSCLG